MKLVKKSQTRQEMWGGGCGLEGSAGGRLVVSIPDPSCLNVGVSLGKIYHFLPNVSSQMIRQVENKLLNSHKWFWKEKRKLIREIITQTSLCKLLSQFIWYTDFLLQWWPNKFTTFGLHSPSLSQPQKVVVIMWPKQNFPTSFAPQTRNVYISTIVAERLWVCLLLRIAS